MNPEPFPSEFFYTSDLLRFITNTFKLYSFGLFVVRMKGKRTVTFPVFSYEPLHVS